jgi:hypothetical protein
MDRSLEMQEKDRKEDRRRKGKDPARWRWPQHF